MTGTRSNPATCLGCGCACDDIDVTVKEGRIVEARHACPLGIAWFGDGVVPDRVRVSGRDAAVAEAIEAAARVLSGAVRPLVYLAPDISCEAQRESIALADGLRATLDTVTSATALPSILAAQELGRAGATLGEVRNRADVIVFWGVDPAIRYPRYLTRYAPDPAGVHVPNGRRSRTVVAVDIGDSRGPADADVRVAVSVDQEVVTLTRLRAQVGAPDLTDPLASAVARGKYIVFVADAEPEERRAAETATARDPGRAAALIALTQALNATTRCALSTLRAGGNRSGADSCLTSQTGYPAAVDFMRGYPRYRPHDAAAARLARGEIDAVLVVGATSLLPDDVLQRLATTPCVVVGPRASEGPLAGAEVVIDTAVAGIHESGTAFRMDDVPLPLAAPLSGPPEAARLVRELRARVSLRGTVSARASA